LLGGLVQPGGAHQVGFQLGQAAFGGFRMPLQQLFADQEAQDRVAQKLELLVIAQAIRTAGQSPFVDVRTMRQRAV
jgi:hypothetical protein